MQFVIDERSVIFDEALGAGNIERLEAFLDLLDDICEESWPLFYSVDLFSKDVLQGLSLYDLYYSGRAISIPRSVQERLGAIFSRIPKCEDSENIPDSFDVSISDAFFQSVSVAWALLETKCGRLTACVTQSGYQFSGYHDVICGGQNVCLYFFAANECYRDLFRDYIANESRDYHDFEKYAQSAFPNLIFLEGVFSGIKTMVRAYVELRGPITNHLAAFSDHGKDIFLGNRAEVEGKFGPLGVDISNENGNTRQDKAAFAERFKIYKGERLEFSWHSKLERHQNRIHICPDKIDTLGKIIVGIFCSHLA